MTAPGPQQPDEVRRELFDSEDVANVVRAIADDLLEWAATLPTGADPHEVYDWLIAQAAKVERPAAPSAQPDEERCGHVSTLGKLPVTCRAEVAPAKVCRLGHVTPAQPVRDTGEGRR